MEFFRNSKLKSLADIKIDKLNDYDKGIDDLPKSNVLKYILEDGSWVAIRPSGTEPKIKFYFGVNSDNETKTDDKLKKLVEHVLDIVNAI